MAASWLNLVANPATVDADTRFNQIAEAEWVWRLGQFPQLATRVGEHRHDDRLEHVDRTSRLGRLEYWRKARAALARIPIEEMSPERRVDRAVFEHQLEGFVAAIEVRAELMPLDGEANFWAPLAGLPEIQPLLNGADYRRYLARLADIPRYFAEHIELLREGLRAGFTPPHVALAGVESSLAAMAATADPARTPFFRPFLAFPPSAPAAEQLALGAQAGNVIAESVLPACRGLTRFLLEEYLPQARRTTSAGDLPGGKAFYDERIRRFTTLSIDAGELHALGLAEVDRIGGEMRELASRLGFESGLPAFVKFLRTDQRFYARSPEELLAQAAWIAKRADGALPAFFARLPRQPYGLAAVPDELTPHHAATRYVPAPQAAGFSGTCLVNTHAMSSRPLFMLPARVLHDGVPGHHLHAALAGERGAHPPFRRFGQIEACSDGWALYAERLGEEMGLYRTRYEQFGRLCSEMWRACLLVVDTGLHALRWGRADARAFLLGHTALGEHEVATEVDRCIGCPGRGLAFKVGEIRLRELRERARSQLGKRFDLREFHDAVLALGCVPLDVLESQIDTWIARRLSP